MDTPNRVVKPQLPLRVILSAAGIGLLIVAFLVIAFYQSGRGLADARMTGKIISKEFQPLPSPERQITINRSGSISAQDTTGQFLIAVEVPQKDGSNKIFNVWLNDKARYDAVKVGDSFDVGPFVIPDIKK